MKFLDKVGLILFSFIVLILSMIMCFMVIGWVQITDVSNVLKTILSNTLYTNIALGVSIAFILLAIKCIYFAPSNKSKNEIGDGILLQNEDGKLLISKDTIENIVNSVAKGFESTQNVKTEVILDKENKLKVLVTLFVLPNVVIKELSSNLQARVKEELKKVTDLDVTEVNIKIRNISIPKTSNKEE